MRNPLFCEARWLDVLLAMMVSGWKSWEVGQYFIIIEPGGNCGVAKNERKAAIVSQVIDEAPRWSEDEDYKAPQRGWKTADADSDPYR